jgi:hypothetical protein
MSGDRCSGLKLLVYKTYVTTVAGFEHQKQNAVRYHKYHMTFRVYVIRSLQQQKFTKHTKMYSCWIK